jgi:hypothetical protein
MNRGQLRNGQTVLVRPYNRVVWSTATVYAGPLRGQLYRVVTHDDSRLHYVPAGRIRAIGGIQPAPNN